jgi:type IV pilus assembly protein PilA
VRKPPAPTPDSRGFTLVELLVVVMIIAVLLGIAIPTFLGARTRAQQRAAQASIRTALTASHTLFADRQNFDAADAAGIHAIEPNLTLHDTGLSTGPNDISVDRVDANGDSFTDEIVLAALARNGVCFVLMDASVDPPGALGAGMHFGSDTPANCDSGSFDHATAPASGWQDSW